MVVILRIEIKGQMRDIGMKEMVTQGDRVVVVTHKKPKMTILRLHLFFVPFYSLKHVPTNLVLFHRLGEIERVTISVQQVRKLIVQDVVSKQPRQAPRF